MKPRPTPRVCHVCGREMGNISLRYQEDGVWKRDYFHLKCYTRFKRSLQSTSLEEDATPSGERQA